MIHFLIGVLSQRGKAEDPEIPVEPSVHRNAITAYPVSTSVNSFTTRFGWEFTVGSEDLVLLGVLWPAQVNETEEIMLHEEGTLVLTEEVSVDTGEWSSTWKNGDLYKPVPPTLLKAGETYIISRRRPDGANRAVQYPEITDPGWIFSSDITHDRTMYTSSGNGIPDITTNAFALTDFSYSYPRNLIRGHSDEFVTSHAQQFGWEFTVGNTPIALTGVLWPAVQNETERLRVWRTSDSGLLTQQDISMETGDWSNWLSGDGYNEIETVGLEANTTYIVSRRRANSASRNITQALIADPGWYWSPHITYSRTMFTDGGDGNGVPNTTTGGFRILDFVYDTSSYVDARTVHQSDSISNVPSVSYWSTADPLYFIGNSPGMTTALRWEDLNIPQGSVIVDARITVYTENNQPTAADGWLDIGVEQVDNATRLTNATNHQNRLLGESGFPGIGPLVRWEHPVDLGSANVPKISPNLSGIVQTIIDRPGWSSGNALMFFAIPNPATTVDYQYRSFFSGVSGTYPRIQIWFIPPT